MQLQTRKRFNKLTHQIKNKTQLPPLLLLPLLMLLSLLLLLPPLLLALLMQL
jgi:hypothetical protein